MQIILLEKVINLGQLGDVVKVKDGYARNFLIPTGKAQRATASAKAAFEAKRAELERQQADKLAAAEATKAQLADVKLSLSEKAGVDGRLFGSVTNANIADALNAKGFKNVEKSMVRMPNGPIKTVGEHVVHLALHTDVTAEIALTVVGEAA
jgi:large subunit ribosomal protein L9